MVDAVVSKPAEELPVNNAKYILNCTELFLAHKGIQVLGGFDQFVNLEVLWLNNNKLAEIVNLDACIRIKELYAHNNNIESLEGSLQCFKFLRTLSVSNNRIKDLDFVLSLLQDNPYLKHLDLSNNPAAEESDYMLRVIAAMPSLEVLDCHAITDEDRRAAARFAKTGQSPTEAPATVVARRARATPLSGCARLLDTEVRRVQREQQASEHARKMALFSRQAEGPPRGEAPLPTGLDFRSAASSAAGSGLGADGAYYLADAFRWRDKLNVGVLPVADLAALLVTDMRDAGLVLQAGEEGRVPDLLDAATRIAGRKDGAVPLVKFVQAVRDGCPATDGTPLPPLRWRRLALAEMRAHADALFSRAAQLQDGDSVAAADVDEVQRLKEALRCAQLAGKLMASCEDERGDSARSGGSSGRSGGGDGVLPFRGAKDTWVASKK